MPGTYAVGVDVGATKILCGVVECKTGKVLSHVKLPSPTGGGQGVMDSVEEAVARAIESAPKESREQIARIGVGLAGQVDLERGVLLWAPNLGGGVQNVEVARPLNARFDLPIVIGNDVDAAATGESYFGAGKGVDLFACIFVGTGIGAALVQNGERYTGASGTAGEIGHMIIRAGGRVCGCGQRGHLEAYSSRTAIVQMLREEVEGGATSSLAPLLLDTSQRVKSKPLAEAVEQGDELVVNTITHAAHYLGLGLASLINLWSPRRIVLGGGVIDRIDLLFNHAVETARSASLEVSAAACDIVRAELGDFSGLVGAAMLK